MNRRIEPHPVRSLPKPMQKYLSIPWKAFAPWSVISLLFFIFLVVSSRPAGTTPASSELSRQAQRSSERTLSEVKVSGEVSFKIKVKEKGHRVYLAGKTYKFKEKENQIKLMLPNGQGQFRLKEKERKLNLYDGNDTLVYRTRDKDGQLHVQDSSGALLYRLKHKDGSFNIYNGSGERILKGKPKSGYVVVKTKPGDVRVLKIRGVSNFRKAALLAIPIEAPYRILLWRYR